METNRLKYFCAVAELGSLSKAAEVLNVSHSGLSKAITALEDEAGLKLFRPLGRGLEITDDGKWFYQKSLEILKIVGEVASGLRKESPSIRVGLSEVLGVSCVSLLARELQSDVTFVEADVGEAERLILKSELDFAFVFSPSPISGIEYLELGEVTFNAFAKDTYLKGKEVSEIFYTVPASQFPFNPIGYKVRDGWPHDLPRTAKFAVSGFSMALDLLRAGESALYMPGFVATLENEKGRGKVIKVSAHKGAESVRKLFLAKALVKEESKEMKKASKVLRKHCCS